MNRIRVVLVVLDANIMTKNSLLASIISIIHC
jgi:hypothetical protein